jgi:DNA repair protein RecO (recombination protein O)
MDSHILIKNISTNKRQFADFVIPHNPMQLHKTKGIVLRTVKYGETSLIVTVYTELFGIQSYIVNGVRSSSRKGPGKANLFQPAALLDLLVYHNDLKNLQRIREFTWATLYKDTLTNILKYAVALYMVELLQKTLKQPEPNPELFYFIEDSFLHLDASEGRVLANFPLFFILHLAGFFGFRIQDTYSEDNAVLDLLEGQFVPEPPHHQQILEGALSYHTAQLLRVQQPLELGELPLNQETRRLLLQAYLTFYAVQIPDFGEMRTLTVLQTVLS